MSPDILQQVMPYAKALRVATFAGPLTDAMLEFDITTPLREAAFLAQVAHESGSLYYVKELADGAAYEGRHDLGNTEPGDGPRFKGRGLLQITGRANYYAVSMALCGDARLLDDPDQLCEPTLAARSAGWFWSKHSLNALADAGDLRTITHRINGGENGYAERLAYYQRAQGILERT